MNVIFFVGLARLLHFQIGGILYGPDILLAGSVLLFISSRAKLLDERRTIGVFMLIGFWFIGALISDIYSATPAEDFLRGWSKIIFFWMGLSGLLLLAKRDYRLLVSFC